MPRNKRGPKRRIVLPSGNIPHSYEGRKELIIDKRGNRYVATIIIGQLSQSYHFPIRSQIYLRHLTELINQAHESGFLIKFTPRVSSDGGGVWPPFITKSKK